LKTSTDFGRYEQMSTPEKILFLEDLWESIAIDDASVIPVPEKHVEELNRRWNGHSASQGAILSLNELQSRINSRK